MTIIFIILFVFVGIMMFLTGGFKFLMKSIYPIKYEKEIDDFSQMYCVEKELIYAIIKCESGFNQNATSSAGALGLMQITPDTFNWLQLYTHEKNLDMQQLMNPAINIKYGTLLISILRKQYENDDAVLSAYNAGDSVVKRWLSDKNISLDGKTLNNIPYKETRNYVNRVKYAKIFYKKLYFER